MKYIKNYESFNPQNEGLKSIITGGLLLLSTLSKGQEGAVISADSAEHLLNKYGVTSHRNLSDDSVKNDRYNRNQKIFSDTITGSLSSFLGEGDKDVIDNYDVVRTKDSKFYVVYTESQYTNQITISDSSNKSGIQFMLNKEGKLMEFWFENGDMKQIYTKNPEKLYQLAKNFYLKNGLNPNNIKGRNTNPPKMDMKVNIGNK